MDHLEAKVLPMPTLDFKIDPESVFSLSDNSTGKQITDASSFINDTRL